MDLLFKFLESVAPLSPELRAYLNLTVKSKTLRKKEFFLKAGRVCDQIAFIENGLVRSFYSEKEKEICSWFNKEAEIIIADRFCMQLPSRVSIQAVEHSHIYYISFGELQALFRLFPEFNYTARELLQKQFASAEDYQYNAKTKDAKERYRYFITDFPELSGRLPLQFLASFLNITPVWLSNIRARFRLNKLFVF